MSAYQPSKRVQRAARLHGLSDELTPCQQEIMIFVCGGMTNRQIAQATCRSIHTVHAHLRSSFAKLYVHNRTEAAIEFMTCYPEVFSDRTESGALHQPISTTKHRREP